MSALKAASSTWPGWEVLIGIETHVQLKSRLKLFSDGLYPRPAQAPNSTHAPFDIALPGTLPRLNRTCVLLGVRAALALNSACQAVSSFDRKHYFYADLPAGYQLTQHYRPYAKGGYLSLDDGLTVNIQQIQLEQDTAKSLAGNNRATVDYNRAGCALLEIVTLPDMRTQGQAVRYVKKLQSLLRAVGITDGNMEDGSLRCDVNVSVRKPGDQYGTRCEVKNLNSTKAIAQAISYEAERHVDILNNGHAIVQETRGFDEDRVATYSLRSKEDSPDYRYMPDPNLPLLRITPEEIEEIQSAMSETPDQGRRRLRGRGLRDQDVEIILRTEALKGVDFDGMTRSGAVAFFDEASQNRDPSTVAKWMVNELLGQLTLRSLTFMSCPVTAVQFGEVIDLLSEGTITSNGAKRIIRYMLDPNSPLTNSRPREIIDQLGLQPGSQSLESFCQIAISDLVSEASAVREGHKGPLNRLVGHVMKLSKGSADARQVRAILVRLLTPG